MRDRSLFTSLSDLCSVAMREMLYAEVDLTGAVVNPAKQGCYSGFAVAIFGLTHSTNPKPGDYHLPPRRDKTAQPWPCVRFTGFHLSYLGYSDQSGIGSRIEDSRPGKGDLRLERGCQGPDSRPNLPYCCIFASRTPQNGALGHTWPATAINFLRAM